MSTDNTPSSDQSDKNPESKNPFIENAKRKAIELIQKSVPVVKVGLQITFAVIRCMLAIAWGQFMRLDQRQRLIAIAVLGIIGLLFGAGLYMRSDRTVTDQAPKVIDTMSTVGDKRDEKTPASNVPRKLKNAGESPQEFKTLLKAAEQGDVEAQNRLAVCYRTGRGVSQDEKEGMRWHRLAAEQGQADSQHALGNWYSYAWMRGKSEDEKAVFWFQKAAEQDHMDSQYDLSICYREGRGVPANVTQGDYWLEKAAEQGHEKAVRDRESIAGFREALMEKEKSRQPLAVSLNSPYKDIYEAIEDEDLAEVRKFIDNDPALVRKLLLHKAAEKNRSTEIVKYLISKGLDVNRQDSDDGTPLHRAATSNKNLAMIKYLVEEAGGNLQIKNMIGQTPLVVSIVHENVAVQKYLESVIKIKPLKSPVSGIATKPPFQTSSKTSSREKSQNADQVLKKLIARYPRHKKLCELKVALLWHSLGDEGVEKELSQSILLAERLGYTPEQLYQHNVSSLRMTGFDISRIKEDSSGRIFIKPDPRQFGR